MEARLSRGLIGLDPGGKDDRVSPWGDDELRKAPAVKVFGSIRQEVPAKIDRDGAGVVELDPVVAFSTRVLQTLLVVGEKLADKNRPLLLRGHLGRAAERSEREHE